MFGRVSVLLCVGGLLALVATTAHAELIAFWPMDEGGGVTVADNIGGYGGTIEGTAGWVQGAFGTAIQFGGGSSGDNVNCGTVDLNIGSNFTLACWVKRDEDVACEVLFAKGPKSAGHYELYINDVGAGGGGRLRGETAGYFPDLGDFYSNIKVNDSTWHHVAWVYNGATMICYVDGGSTGQKTWAVSGKVASTTEQFRIGSLADKSLPYAGMLDELAIFDEALTVDEIQAAMAGLSHHDTASAPSPADGDDDVLRTTALSWTPGEFAVTHDVYLGTSADAVLAASRANPGDVLISRNQATATCDLPARLEFGRTYYWRVDEVNGAPDYTISTGAVWSFTAESFVYRITGIAATSNGISDTGMGADRTVDLSGLNADGQHSTLDTDMWLAAPVADEPLWIQYEFDRVYKLHEMDIWNYNVSTEKVIGLGLKDVTIDYSTDGMEWATLGDFQINRAAGSSTYTYNTTIDFGDAAAKYVRVVVQSGWGTLGYYGLSEVQFHQIPTFARKPAPADGESRVSVDAGLSWRAGREAVSHQLYFGTDEAAVAGGAELADTVTQNQYDPGPLDVGTTYYWRVDEVNEAEADSVWEGTVWSFSTQDSLMVEGFESYEDEQPLRIFDTWVDGWGQETTNGAIVGHGESPFTERKIVHDGLQSMNLVYNNGTAKYSEAERTWTDPSDWTLHGPSVLRLWLKGRPTPGEILFDAAGGSYTLSSAGDGSSRNISGTADAFHFAYVSLTGNGSITARVDSITGAGALAKVGVMVRESLDAGAAHGMMAVMPGNQASLVYRATADGASTEATGTAGESTLPRWVKITRTGNVLRAEQSSDGTNWVGPTADASQTEAGVWLPDTVYIGLAFSSYTAGFAQATFSNVKTTGTVSGGGTFTKAQDIGIESNMPDRLYVTLQDKAGHSGTVSQEAGSGAVNMTYWNVWDVPLAPFASAGVNLASVKKMCIGVGDRNAAASGATGVIYIDDIQLCRGIVATGEPVLQLDAMALALQEGDAVGEWGGVQAAGTPVFKQSQTPGGGPAVYFDGASHLGLVSLASSSAGDFIFAAVISPEDINGYHNIFEDDTEARPMIWVDGRSPSTYEANWSPTGAIATEAGASGTEEWDIVIMDSRSGLLFLNNPTVPYFINAITWSPQGGSQEFCLFNRNGGAAFHGRVAEVRVYNDAKAFGMDYAGLYQELFDKWFVEK